MFLCWTLIIQFLLREKKIVKQFPPPQFKSPLDFPWIQLHEKIASGGGEMSQLLTATTEGTTFSSSGYASMPCSMDAAKT